MCNQTCNNRILILTCDIPHSVISTLQPANNLVIFPHNIRLTLTFTKWLAKNVNLLDCFGQWNSGVDLCM